eukprot:1160121-Pelagomonas_calceolata.AAC.10
MAALIAASYGTKALGTMAALTAASQGTNFWQSHEIINMIKDHLVISPISLKTGEPRNFIP